jgi:hypothetical protein
MTQADAWAARILGDWRSPPPGGDYYYGVVLPLIPEPVHGLCECFCDPLTPAYNIARDPDLRRDLRAAFNERALRTWAANQPDRRENCSEGPDGVVCRRIVVPPPDQIEDWPPLERTP